MFRMRFRYLSSFFVAPLFFCLSSPADSDTESWRTAIENVRETISEYCEYARAIDGSCSAGTAYNGIGYGQHTCAIIARMLSITEHRDRLEKLDAPPLDGTTTGHDAAIHAATLDAWITAAERLLDQSEEYKISVWNLDCVGRFGISSDALLNNTEPAAEFEVRDSGLYIYGDIDPGFYQRLLDFLQNSPHFHTVFLGSAGGSVSDAIQAGRLLRRLGITTSIFGNCFSACPLVFVGGVDRMLWASESRLGFHQISRNGEPIPLDDPAYLVVMDYLYEMGVNGDMVVGWMLQMEPSGMLLIEANELCPSNIATFIQRVC